MNTLSFPQITVSYKDADASKRVKIHSSKESYDILKTLEEDYPTLFNENEMRR